MLETGKTKTVFSVFCHATLNGISSAKFVSHGMCWPVPVATNVRCLDNAIVSCTAAHASPTKTRSITITSFPNIVTIVVAKTMNKPLETSTLELLVSALIDAILDRTIRSRWLAKHDTQCLPLAVHKAPHAIHLQVILCSQFTTHLHLHQVQRFLVMKGASTQRYGLDRHCWEPQSESIRFPPSLAERRDYTSIP